MERLEDQIQFYKRLLAEDSTSRLFIKLAELLYEAQRWSEVVEVCREGIRVHPDSIQGRTLLGLALKEMGRDEEAEEVLETVYDEFMKNALALKALAHIYQKKDEKKKANRLLEVYGSLNKKSTDSRLIVSMLELWLEELEKSVVIESTKKIFEEEDRNLIKNLIKQNQLTYRL